MQASGVTHLSGHARVVGYLQRPLSLPLSRRAPAWSYQPAHTRQHRRPAHTCQANANASPPPPNRAPTPPRQQMLVRSAAAIVACWHSILAQHAFCLMQCKCCQHRLHHCTVVDTFSDMTLTLTLILNGILCMQIYVPPHPLIQHWLAIARNDMTPPPIFRAALAELGRILVYEAGRDWLPTMQQQISSPV